MAVTPDSEGVGQISDRLVVLLAALAEANGPLPAGELAERTGIPVSSTYRLVQALERHGLVERRSRRGIVLGLRMLEFARRTEDRLGPALLRPARGPMEDLAQETRETVLLTAPSGLQSIGLASIDSPRSVRLTYGHWRLAPMHRGASGKILLANLDETQAARVLAAAQQTESADDVADLGRELAKIRRRGYVVTDSELDAGTLGIAAPIFDAGGRLLAGLTVAGPTERMRPSEDSIVAAVIASAQQVQTAIERSWNWTMPW